MALDALSPSPLHAALFLAFQVALPGFALGLAHYLAVLEGLWLITGNATFRTLYLAWLPIFAVALGLCAVAALVMSAGPPQAPAAWIALIAGAALAALAAMLFGWRATGTAPHFLATLGVAVGALAWAAWIASVDGMGPARSIRLVLSAYLITALVVAAGASWRLLRDPLDASPAVALRMAIGMFAIVAPLLFVDAGPAGRPAHRATPIELATIETFRPGRGDPGLRIPTRSGHDVVGDGGASIPGATSRGIMAGFGLGVIGLSVWGVALMLRGRLERAHAFQIACVAMGPSGFVLAAWIWTAARQTLLSAP